MPTKCTSAPNVSQKIWGKIATVFPTLFDRSSLLFNVWKFSEEDMGIRVSKVTFYESCFSFKKSEPKI